MDMRHMVFLALYSSELYAIFRSLQEMMCCMCAARVGLNNGYWKMSQVSQGFLLVSCQVGFSIASHHCSGMNLLESANTFGHFIIAFLLVNSVCIYHKR